MKGAAMLVVALAVGGGTGAAIVAEGADAAKGQVTYQKSCASCHGVSGKGDGPMAARINPKLRDLTDKAYNASLKDDYLSKLILEGGKALGKSPLMPKKKDVLSQDDVDDVIAYLRGLAK